LNHKREVILMISVGGGLQLPLMEGDKIRAGERENKPVYYWFPLSHDGKTLDLSRSRKGSRSERYLHPRFVESLRLGNQLTAVNGTDFVVRAAERETAPDERTGPEPVPPAAGKKRRPLLRLPVWGLPPRWH
jgi:hypothetical protein